MLIKKEINHAASYNRLSREDGDKLESDSIVNQQRIIEDYCASRSEIELTEVYIDDGATGTNFNRPGFLRMLADIEAGKIDCVIVKDLSRFGRDYIDMGYYLERYFPAHNVRFIAINDNVDSYQGPYDMMLPLKNVFNSQYAKDISGKVRSAFRTKQRRGEFVGAFASYGYLKDPDNHNRLIPDPVASEVVRRVFQMAAEGCGQIRIAKVLNEEQIPCPSEYKRLMGERYSNNHRLESTRYWTYATVHKMLRNEMYLGNMVQNRTVRPTMHGKAVKADKSDWVVVENTHDAIIPRELWDCVQAQIAGNTRPPGLDDHVHLFAGLVKCGDCGRAMCRKTAGGHARFSCGSYERYGPTACSKHSISEQALTDILLTDINRIITAVTDLKRLAEEHKTSCAKPKGRESEQKRLKGAIERLRRLKRNVYEDYRDGLLNREEFIRYKADYDGQEATLQGQLERLEASDEDEIIRHAWVERLVELGELKELDRETVTQLVKTIRVFEDHRIEITYLFSEELGLLLD